MIGKGMEKRKKMPKITKPPTHTLPPLPTPPPTPNPNYNFHHFLDMMDGAYSHSRIDGLKIICTKKASSDNLSPPSPFLPCPPNHTPDTNPLKIPPIAIL